MKMQPMPRTHKTLRRHIAKVWKLVDSKDPIESRVAYEIYHVLRWAIEETVGWDTPEEMVEHASELIRNEWKDDN